MRKCTDIEAEPEAEADGGRNPDHLKFTVCQRGRRR
jgi:hypothetical protein